MEEPLLCSNSSAKQARTRRKVCQHARRLLDATCCENYLKNHPARRTRYISIPMMAVLAIYRDSSSLNFSQYAPAELFLLLVCCFALCFDHSRLVGDVVLFFELAAFSTFVLPSSDPYLSAHYYMLLVLYVFGVHLWAIVAAFLVCVPKAGFGIVSPLICVSVVITVVERFLWDVQSKAVQHSLLLEEGFSGHFEIDIELSTIVRANGKAQALGVEEGKCFVDMLDDSDQAKIRQMMSGTESGTFKSCLVTLTLGVLERGSRFSTDLDCCLLPFARNELSGTVSIAFQTMGEYRSCAEQATIKTSMLRDVPHDREAYREQSSSSIAGQSQNIAASQQSAPVFPLVEEGTAANASPDATTFNVDGERRSSLDITFNDLASYHSFCNFTAQWSTNMTDEDVRMMHSASDFIASHLPSEREVASKNAMYRLQRQRFDRLMDILSVFVSVRERTFKKDVDRKRNRADFHAEAVAATSSDRRTRLALELRHARWVQRHAALSFTERNYDIGDALSGCFLLIEHFLGRPLVLGPQHNRVIFPNEIEFSLHTL